MKVSAYYLVFCFIVCLLPACKSAPEIAGFDSKKWKDDPDACKNDRAKLLPLLEKNKGKLVKVESAEILMLLGSPDKKELYKRNQRFYVYFATSGSQCKGTKGNLGKTLRVRIDALQRVSEIVVN